MPLRFPVTYRFRFIVVSIIFSTCFAIYSYLKYRPPYHFYESLSAAEAQESKKWIEGFDRHKYVRFKQLQGAGFNNQAQEILLFHHLALQSSRIYVYQPFYWQPRKEWLPLSSLLLGPTKGTVSQQVFDEICLPQETKHIEVISSYNELWKTARDLLDGSERCIAIDNWILNWDFLSSSAIASIWPGFQHYLTQHFEWPEHILAIVARAHTRLNLKSDKFHPNGEPYLALHLRRGDFETHCQSLSSQGAPFTTWSTLPLLQKSVYPPALDTSNATSILEHCYPSLHRILDVIDMQLRARPDLRTVHILHDASWSHPLVYSQFYKLEVALKDADRAHAAGWSNGLRLVTHSAMLPTTWGERDWKVAVDIELARQAEVFVGNGYSSLSSMIIALRLADGGSASHISLM